MRTQLDPNGVESNVEKLYEALKEQLDKCLDQAALQNAFNTFDADNDGGDYRDSDGDEQWDVDDDGDVGGGGGYPFMNGVSLCFSELK